MCAALWMTGLILFHQVHLHIFFSLYLQSHRSFFVLTVICFISFLCSMCLYVPKRVIGCYYRVEGKACLFQGTPPELMFHTCAQCSTLYQASQVHPINCGRNHILCGSSSPTTSLAWIQSLNIHIEIAFNFEGLKVSKHLQRWYEMKRTTMCSTVVFISAYMIVWL